MTQYVKGQECGINDYFGAVLPSGRKTYVSAFDYNLAVCAGALDSYIQMSDTSWAKVRTLKTKGRFVKRLVEA